MEEFFTGCDGWLTGIEALDTQHVELAACISRVAGVCRGSKNMQTGGSVSRNRDLSEVVDHLYRKTKEHFEYEEAVMRETEYPDFAAHRREHIMLLAELKLAIDREPGSVGIKVDSEMVRELKAWFMAHIKQSDCRFSAYISSRGMASKLNVKVPDKTLDL